MLIFHMRATIMMPCFLLDFSCSRVAVSKFMSWLDLVIS